MHSYNGGPIPSRKFIIPDPANRSLRRRSRLKQKTSYQVLEPRNLLAAAPIVSEFLASNDNGLVDDNGNSSDWIEIFNAGDDSINLAGFTLTDDADEFDKWTFPSVNLAAAPCPVQEITLVARPLRTWLILRSMAVRFSGLR